VPQKEADSSVEAIKFRLQEEEPLRVSYDKLRLEVEQRLNYVKMLANTQDQYLRSIAHQGLDTSAMSEDEPPEPVKRVREALKELQGIGKAID